MATVDWVLRNGRLVTPGGILMGGLAVAGQQIVAIATDDALPSAAEEYDANGSWVLPGGVDTHVHIHYNSPTWRGDFASETAAALQGGTTTVAEFSFDDGTDLVDSFNIKRRTGEQLAFADFGMHAIFRKESDLRLVSRVVDAGALSIKAMMANPNGITPVLDGVLVELFSRVARARGIQTVHAENEEIQLYHQRKFKKQGRSGPLEHALSRPTISEGEAISRAILFARWCHTRLHIFHMSSALGVELLAAAKARGLAVTGETCPHYLMFTQEDITSRWGPFLQVNPSLKLSRDRQALWKALEAGHIDAVVSDHYAPSREEKEAGWKNIWEVEGGVPGIESRLAVLWHLGVETERLSPERFVHLTATGPAQIFGLYPRKGVLAIGSDADIVVWDPTQRWVLGPASLHQTADWTPFEGTVVHARPRLVFLRGRLCVREGKLLAPRGYGEFVPRRP